MAVDDRYLNAQPAPAISPQALFESIPVIARLVNLDGSETWAPAVAGYWVCRVAGSGPEQRIDETTAAAGVQAARRRLGSLVHEPALRDLSAVDRTFLSTMAQDDGPSRMAEIAERMKVTANYASQYRRRLIAADLIYPTTHGSVDFTLPHLREYLREHAASTVLEPEEPQ